LAKPGVAVTRQGVFRSGGWTIVALAWAHIQRLQASTLAIHFIDPLSATHRPLIGVTLWIRVCLLGCPRCPGPWPLALKHHKVRTDSDLLQQG
jgi:hypothetical protein